MFWDKLQFLLNQKNMKQVDLAKACNIPTTTISMWKAGHRPNLANLIQLSTYFNVSIDYFIGQQDITFKMQDIKLTKEQTELILKFEQADELEKIIIKKLLHIK